MKERSAQVPGAAVTSVILDSIADGVFTVSLSGTFRPSPGDVFSVLSYRSATNEFVCYGGLDLGDGVMLVPDFGKTAMKLKATPYAASSSTPSLFIGRSLGGVSVFWNTGYTGWSLESTTNLISPNWLPIPASAGCANQVVVPSAEAEQYFRLKQNTPP